MATSDLFFCGCGPFLDGETIHSLERSGPRFQTGICLQRSNRTSHATTINWHGKIDGAGSANSADYFQYSGKAQNTFEGKDAKTDEKMLQRPSEQAQSSAKPRAEIASQRAFLESLGRFGKGSDV